jgi:hypothetical protein
MRPKTTRFAFAAACSILVAASAAAQLPKVETGPIASLAELVPETVLGYYKLVDPVGDFERLMGSDDVWKAPQKMTKKTRRTMERGFKAGDKEMGLQDGSLDSWLHSIGTVELALFNLSFDESFDEPPRPDFAVIMESPLAIEIYNQVAQMMIDRGVGARTEGGQLQLGLGDGFAPMFAIYGNKVVLASDQSRLDEILKSAKTGLPNSLASSASFRAVCGDASGPRVGYMRFGALLTLIRDRLPDHQQRRMDDVIRPLGLTKVEAIGYRENGPNGVFTLKGSEPIKLFQLLKAKEAPPTLQSNLPAETAVSFTHTGDAGPHLRRIEAFLTDKVAFPFAPMVGAAIATANVKTGLTTEAAFEPLKDGFVIAILPDENGRLHEADGAVLVASLPVAEEAEKYLDRLKRAFAKATRCEMTDVVEDGVRWIREKPGTRKDDESEPTLTPPAQADEGEADVRQAEELKRVADPENPDEEVIEVRVGTDSAPTASRRRASRVLRQSRSGGEAVTFAAAYNGKLLVVGGEPYVKRTLKSESGQAPTLASTGSYARLPQKATFFTTMSLRSIFGQSGEFSAAFSFLKDWGAIGAAATAEDDKLVVTFNRAPGQIVGLMMGAGIAGEDNRDQQSAVRAALVDIGVKTKAFKEKNKVWPKSLAELGFEAGKAPSFADEDGKSKPIVFLPPKGDPENGWDVMLAYWDSADSGHLVLNLDGYATIWSESRFLTGLSKYNAVK